MRIRGFCSLVGIVAAVSVAAAAAPGAARGWQDSPASQPSGAANGSMRGRISAADTGVPLAGAQVRVGPPGTGEWRVTVTDEFGRFEMVNLPAGRYTVETSAMGYVKTAFGQRKPSDRPRPAILTPSLRLDNVDMALPKAGVVVARVTDEFGEPIARMQVQIEQYRFVEGRKSLTSAVVPGQFQDSDDRGEVRLHGLAPGDYYVSAGPGFLGLSEPRTASYATTYYPGTADPQLAQRVAVRAGQEVSVTIPLERARYVTISGMVRDSRGAAIPQARIGLAAGPRRFTTGIEPDGTFRLRNLPPGEYVIEVGPGPGSSTATVETARVPVSAIDSDISGLIITTGRGGTASGRFSFDTGANPGDLRPDSLQLVGATGGDPTAGRVTTHDDWAFDVAGLLGQRLFRLRSTMHGWFLKAVLLNGRDVTDAPIDFNSATHVRDLEIVLTQKQTVATGSVVDARNATVSDYAVIVFSENRDLWTPQSRFIGVGTPEGDAQFRIVGLPPGRYYAAALESIESGEERDPELLERLVQDAQRVTLADGEARTMTLRLQ